MAIFGTFSLRQMSFIPTLKSLNENALREGHDY